MENTSFRFPDEVITSLEDIAKQRHTTVEKLLARAVATEVFLDQFPPGTKFLVLKPDGKFEEVIRPEPAGKGA